MYIDTERNKHHQLPLMLKQILLDSKLTKEELKSKFTILPFSEISRVDRLEVMGAQYRDLKSSITESPNNTLIIILDIVSDFILDFNNTANDLSADRSLKFKHQRIQYYLHGSIARKSGVSDKARGHLGTELAEQGFHSVADCSN